MKDAAVRAEVDDELRRLLETGSFQAAVTLGLRMYGPEVCGFLYGLLRTDQDTDEVYARFAARLWETAPSFRGDCSFRTWVYLLARQSVAQHLREQRLKLKHEDPLPEGSDIPKMAVPVPTQTPSYLRTKVRARLDALRETLPLDDQSLLILRIDRRLAWKEIAAILHEGENPLSEDEMKAASARWRKRFELLKDRIRQQLAAQSDKES